MRSLVIDSGALDKGHIRPGGQTPVVAIRSCLMLDTDIKLALDSDTVYGGDPFGIACNGKIMKNCFEYSFALTIISWYIQANLDMTDSMGPGKLVRYMQNPSYTYDTYLLCMWLGLSTSSVICKGPSYSRSSYPSSPVEWLNVTLLRYYFLSFTSYQDVCFVGSRLVVIP